MAVLVASFTALALLAACSSDSKLTVPTSAADTTEVSVPTEVTLPAGITIPDNITIPEGVSIPSDFSVPQETLDLMLAQFEAAGMKIDKECFRKLLGDDSLRKLVEAGGTPTPETIQKFVACITP